LFFEKMNLHMQHERHDFDGEELAEIWRRAEHRRTEDIRCWFAELFNKRRPLKSPDARSFDAAALLRALTSQSEPLLPSGPGVGGSRKGDGAKGGQSGQ
jgi:hypothetical protein